MLSPALSLAAVFVSMLWSFTIANASNHIDSPPPSISGASVFTILSFGPSDLESMMTCKDTDMDNNLRYAEPIKEVLNQWELTPSSGPSCKPRTKSTVEIDVNFPTEFSADLYLDAMIDKRGAAFLIQSYQMPCRYSSLKLFSTLNGSSYLFVCDANDFTQVQSDYGSILEIMETPTLCCPSPPPPLPSPLPPSPLSVIPPDVADVKSVQPINVLPVTSPVSQTLPKQEITPIQQPTSSQPGGSPKILTSTLIIIGVAVPTIAVAAIAAIVMLRRRRKQDALDCDKSKESIVSKQSSIGSTEKTREITSASVNWMTNPMTMLESEASTSLQGKPPVSLRGESKLERSSGGAQ